MAVVSKLISISFLQNFEIAIQGKLRFIVNSVGSKIIGLTWKRNMARVLDMLAENGWRALLVVLSALCLVSLVKFLGTRGQLPLPPKPKGLPIIGNTIEFISAAKG